jgi:hypothetical protein
MKKYQPADGENGRLRACFLLVFIFSAKQQHHRRYHQRDKLYAGAACDGTVGLFR